MSDGPTMDPGNIQRPAVTVRTFADRVTTPRQLGSVIHDTFRRTFGTPPASVPAGSAPAAPLQTLGDLYAQTFGAALDPAPQAPIVVPAPAVPPSSGVGAGVVLIGLVLLGGIGYGVYRMTKGRAA